LVFAGCGRPIPERAATWNGTVELAPGILLPFEMSLDLSSPKPTGYFLVGDEKTPIPEISKSGNSLTLGFSEYQAEMRGTWNGREWTGNYLRHRSSGTKSFKFTASPKADSSVNVSANSPNAALPVGNFQVVFQDKGSSDNTTVAKLWSKG